MPAGAGATLLGLPRLGLFGLVALGALSQLLIQTQAYGGNPVVLVPSSDAAVLWERGMTDRGWGRRRPHAPGHGSAAPLDGRAGARPGRGLIKLRRGAVRAPRDHRGLPRGRRCEADPCSGSWRGLAPGKEGLLAGVLFLLLDEQPRPPDPLAGTLQLTAGAALLLAVSSGLRGVGPGRAGSRAPRGAVPRVPARTRGDPSWRSEVLLERRDRPRGLRGRGERSLHRAGDRAQLRGVRRTDPHQQPRPA